MNLEHLQEPVWPQRDTYASPLVAKGVNIRLWFLKFNSLFVFRAWTFETYTTCCLGAASPRRFELVNIMIDKKYCIAKIKYSLHWTRREWLYFERVAGRTQAPQTWTSSLLRMLAALISTSLVFNSETHHSELTPYWGELRTQRKSEEVSFGEWLPGFDQSELVCCPQGIERAETTHSCFCETASGWNHTAAAGKVQGPCYIYIYIWALHWNKRTAWTLKVTFNLTGKLKNLLRSQTYF